VWLVRACSLLPPHFEADFKDSITGTKETLNSSPRSVSRILNSLLGREEEAKGQPHFFFKEAELRPDPLLGQTKKSISPLIFEQANFKSISPLEPGLSESEPKGGGTGQLLASY